MADPAKKLEPATMADLEALPPNIKGEIIDGVLYTQPRPRAGHQNVLYRIISRLRRHYGDEGEGPGGWVILQEPGIELPGSPEFSPDIAGWRRERLGDWTASEPLRIAPDWACEAFSPFTRRYDLHIKKPFYARIGVKWLWYVDLERQTLTAYRLHEGLWLELGSWAGDDVARVEPFEEVELSLARWWTI